MPAVRSAGPERGPSICEDSERGLGKANAVRSAYGPIVISGKDTHVTPLEASAGSLAGAPKPYVGFGSSDVNGQT